MKDETLHTISIVWLAAIVGIIAGACLGMVYALAAVVAVTAIVVAYIVAGHGLGDGNENE